MNLPGVNYDLLMVIFVLGAVLLLISGAYIYKYFSRLKKSIALHSHRRDGARGEVMAKQYLINHGFTILKEQAVSENQIIVDSEPLSFQLRADFIVKKEGKISVVDAKSGNEGIDPTYSETRRQLLEYFVYYKVDSAYIYNSKDDTLHEVVFPIDKVGQTDDKKSFSVGFLILLVIIIELILIVSVSYFR